MKHVKIFEEFIFELADLNRGYPFKLKNIIQDEVDFPPQSFEYVFQTKAGTEYEVQFSLDEFTQTAGYDVVYEIGFFPVGGNYYNKTDEGDALRILLTVANIVAEIINTYPDDVHGIPIYAKGTEKLPADQDVRNNFTPKKETKNDRINKFLAQKILSSTSAKYSFKDLGKNGFILLPHELKSKKTLTREEEYDEQY